MKLINPELYYKTGNASTIISTMGTPIAGGLPIEKVMATKLNVWSLAQLLSSI